MSTPPAPTPATATPSASSPTSDTTEIEQKLRDGVWQSESIYYTASNGVSHQQRLKKGTAYRSTETSDFVCFVSHDDTIYRIGDSVYLDSQRLDQPYYLAWIQSFRMTKREQLNVLVKWYYRPCELPEIVYDSLLQERNSEEHCLGTEDLSLEEQLKEKREIFISDAVDTYSVSALRGKSYVQYFKEISSAREFVLLPDHFYYILGYNPETNRLASIQGEIRVGQGYQARLPDFNKGGPAAAAALYDDDLQYRKRETLLWTPSRIADSDLMMFLRAARSMAAFAGMCDGGSPDDGRIAAARDQTTTNAFNTLHASNYDTGKALQQLVKNPIPLSAEKKWNEEETKKFVKGLKQYGKNFYRIRKELLPHKETGELVSFYYLWKKNPGTNYQRPRIRHRRPHTNVLRRSKASGAGKGASRPASSEFIDLNSASENEFDSEEDANSKDSVIYACHHCYTRTSKDWHHAGKDRTLLCTECRIYFKKYGELPLVNRPNTPPSYLFKPVKEEPDDFYQSGIRTRRSGKEYYSKRRTPSVDGTNDSTKSKLSSASSKTATSSNGSASNVAPKSPSSVSTSSNESGLDQEKKSLCTKRKKRKLDKEDTTTSGTAKTEKTGERGGKSKRGRKRSNHSETGSASSNESTGGHEGDTEMHDDNSSSPCTPSPPTAACRNVTDVAVKTVCASIEESIANVVRDSLVSTPPEVSPPPSDSAVAAAMDTAVPADPSNDDLPMEEDHRGNPTVAATAAAAVPHLGDKESTGTMTADEIPQPEPVIPPTSRSVICSTTDMAHASERAVTPVVPRPSSATQASALSKQDKAATLVTPVATTVSVTSATTITSPSKVTVDLGIAPVSVPVTAQLFIDTSAATTTIKDMKVVVKQEPADVEEKMESENDDNDYFDDHSLPVVREPEPKIDDGTECHRTKNAIFRRHWYRGGNNSCSRTDLVFIPLPDSPLAKKRQREFLKKQSEIKEEKRERTPAVSGRAPSRLSVSASQSVPGAVAAMGFNPVSSSTSCSTAVAYATSAMNGGPGSFPPGFSPFALCFGTGHDLPALQRLKEYASAATNAAYAPGSSNFYQAALLDPVLQYRISAGLYGAAEKERLEHEARERQQEQLKREYEFASKPVYQMGVNNALPTNAAANMGLAAASINALGAASAGGAGVADSRQLFGVPGQYSPVNNAAALGLSPNQATAAFPYPTLDANTLERFQTERLLAERVQLERLTALYPANPMLRLELDRLTAALTALAAQHHTHSHTHSHTHLHIHPSSASSSVQQESGTTSSVAASTSLWSAPQAPNMTDNFMQQYVSLFRPPAVSCGVPYMDGSIALAPSLISSFPGVPPPGFVFPAAAVGMDPLAAERLQQLQQEHFQRQIALERDRILSAQQQQVVLQHNEMMRRLQQEGSMVGGSAITSVIRPTQSPFDKR